MLQIQNLNYQIGNKKLLNNISVEFQKGVLYGLMGPNGSGKTTLLKNIAKIWKPTSGMILWKNENLHSKSSREISGIVSFLPQVSEKHFFDFSVYDIVRMGLYSKGKGSVERSLKEVDAWQFRDESINNISCGERQRVLLARSLVGETPVILLDEPTSSLDIKHQIDIYDILKNLKKEKIIIVSMHDIRVAERLFDEIVVLKNGENISNKNLYSVFGVYEKAPFL